MDRQCQQSYSTRGPFFFGGGFADAEGGSRQSNEKEHFFPPFLTFYFEQTNNSPCPRCFYVFCVNNATPTRYRLEAKMGPEGARPC